MSDRFDCPASRTACERELQALYEIESDLIRLARAAAKKMRAIKFDSSDTDMIVEHITDAAAKVRWEIEDRAEKLQEYPPERIALWDEARVS